MTNQTLTPEQAAKQLHDVLEPRGRLLLTPFALSLDGYRRCFSPEKR